MSGDGDYVQESEGERMMADLSEEQWQDYQDRFIPLENQFMKRVDNIRDERDLAVGRAGATVTQAFDDTHKNVIDMNTRRGAAPGSGMFNAGLADASVAEAKSKGTAMVGADRNTEKRYYAGKQQVVNMGRGVATDANLGMRTMAGLDAATARSDAQAASTVNRAMWDAAGTAAGVAGRWGLEQAGKDK